MRLNLGCGGQVVDSWENLDRAGDPPIIIHDLRDPLPYPDNSVEMAVAHHVLDLLEERDLKALLVDVERVLFPGGVLRISSIDIAKARKAVQRGDLDWFTSRGIPGNTIQEVSRWWLDCGGARKTILFSIDTLAAFLYDAGFKWTEVDYHETATVASICDLDSRREESWFVEATKA